MQAKQIHLWTEASFSKLKHNFDKMIKIYDFIKNEEESCIYKWANDSVIIFLVLYVDDILLMESDIPALQNIKLWLSS